jgi:hypothetical protein
MKLEQRRQCFVGVSSKPSAGQLESFLSKPTRVLRCVLDPKRLNKISDDTYSYASRPYKVAGLCLQPSVMLRARFQSGVLSIDQVSADIKGLSALYRQLSFGLEAKLRVSDDAKVLGIEALIWLKLPDLVAPALVPVAGLAMNQLLDRLERRCETGIDHRFALWLSCQN